MLLCHCITIQQESFYVLMPYRLLFLVYLEGSELTKDVSSANGHGDSCATLPVGGHDLSDLTQSTCMHSIEIGQRLIHILTESSMMTTAAKIVAIAQ